jgi:hypothetical protein
VARVGNANIAGNRDQALVVLSREIIDPEANGRVLVDHPFIVAGGEITR